MTETLEKTTFVSTKESLIHTAIPLETRTYKPYTHQNLMELTLEGIDRAGFILDKELYTSANDGKIATARYSIQNVADSEMNLQIGWQNSYNKKVSLKFCLGTVIAICSNGLVHGDMGSYKKMHKGDIASSTPIFIEESLKSAEDVFFQIQKDREAMKEIEVSKRVQSEILGRLFFEEELIKSTQINIIKGELDNPTFDYGAPNSLWTLYQHITYSLKEIHPTLYFDTHQRAHNLFVDLIK